LKVFGNDLYFILNTSNKGNLNKHSSMKILNENELFIETADLVAAGFNINTIYSSCRHGYSTLPYQKDPSNAKLNVYPYEKLGRRYKEAIEKFFGNPYDHIAREPIKAMVKPDHAIVTMKARAFLPNM
jgi:hypothetical protein